MEEQHEGGFLSHRYFDEVCRHCIGDPTLAIFVAGHGQIDECKFCDVPKSWARKSACCSTTWPSA